MLKKLIQILIEKYMNIPIMQLRFINIKKQKQLKQITKTNKISTNIYKNYSKFFENSWKKFLWTLDVKKLRAMILNMVKIYKQLVK